MKSLLALKQHCIGVNVRLSLCPSDVLMKLFDDIENDIANLQATIEAQEIIIKDKNEYMKAMAKANSCEGCAHHPLNSNDPYDLACSSCKRDGNDNFELHIDKAQP